MKLTIKREMLRKIMNDVDELYSMRIERKDLVHSHRREEGRISPLLSLIEIQEDQDWFDRTFPEKAKRLERTEVHLWTELSNLAPDELAEVCAIMDIGREKYITGRNCGSEFRGLKRYFLDGMDRGQAALYLISKLPLDSYLHHGVAVLGIA